MSVVEACHYVFGQFTEDYLSYYKLVLLPSAALDVPRLEELDPWIPIPSSSSSTPIGMRYNDRERITRFGNNIIVVSTCLHSLKTIRSINKLGWKPYRPADLRKSDKLGILKRIHSDIDKLNNITTHASPASTRYGLLKLAGYLSVDTTSDNVPRPMVTIKPKSISSYKTTLDNIYRRLSPPTPYLKWMHLSEYSKNINPSYVPLLHINQLGDPLAFQFGLHVLEQRLLGKNGMLIWYRFTTLAEFDELVASGAELCKCGNKSKHKQIRFVEHDDECEYHAMHGLSVLWPEYIRRTDVRFLDDDTIKNLNGSWICLGSNILHRRMKPLSVKQSLPSQSTVTSSTEIKEDYKRWSPNVRIDHLMKVMNTPNTNNGNEAKQLKAAMKLASTSKPLVVPDKKKKPKVSTPAKKPFPSSSTLSSSSATTTNDNNKRSLETSIDIESPDNYIEMINKNREEANKKFKKTTIDTKQTKLAFSKSSLSSTTTTYNVNDYDDGDGGDGEDGYYDYYH